MPHRGSKRARAMQARGAKSAGRMQKRRRLTTLSGIPRVVENTMGLLSNRPAKIISLRFAEQFTLNAGVGGIATETYRANSVFDPNNGGVLTQPRGFDQFAAMYDHYEVLDFSWEATYVTRDGGSSQIPSLCGTYLRRTGTPHIILAALEDASTKYGVVSYGGRSTKVTGKANIKKTLGIIGENSRLVAEVTTNPSEMLYLHVFVAASGSVPDPGNVDVTVRFNYRVKFREAKMPAPST